MTDSNTSAPVVAGARLDHVAFGVESIDAITPFIVGRLGGRPSTSGPGLGFRGAQWEFRRGALLEVIEPNGDDNEFLQRFLATRGPGVHHVTFKIDDIGAARRAVENAGYNVVGFSDAVPSWKEMFIHPKQALGIVVQLAECRPELGDDGWGPQWPFAPYAQTSPPAADVVGLRMSCTESWEARALWSGLLGGRHSLEGDVLVFEWHDSPLRISVETDPTRSPGPVAIEVAGDDAAAVAAPCSDSALATAFIAV